MGIDKGLFVTGTDTGVGKTVVAAALIRRLVQMRCSVGVMKPVETGLSVDLQNES
ncbi:MAG: AAA family ATPase, partial [Nitrospira sp.]|nr:AAA family ATPase [Nitrospira sp.]